MKYKLSQIFKNNFVTGISFDSRNVKAGDAFFALRGINFDGNDYVSQALNHGAKIVITDKLTEYSQDPRIIYVDDAKIALSYGASILYPKTPEHLVAVTGTNGKTSVVSYVRQLLTLLRCCSASIGTLGIELGDNIGLSLDDNINTTTLTTADTVTLRKTLNDLAIKNVNYVALEASSHGLCQKRMHGITVCAAAFTSFTQDHLDYHHTMEQYLSSKLKLFSENLVPGGVAVINSEITNIDLIKEYLKQSRANVITVGKNGDVNITQSHSTINGQTIEFSYLDKIYDAYTEIISRAQGINVLIAAILVESLGFVFQDIVRQFPMLRMPQGRLERVTDNNSKFHIFIDYAHTPDALEKSLQTLKDFVTKTGKLKVIFGCGGERDKAKRPIMGRLASEIADMAIITDDNPRNEDPNFIRRSILSEIKLAIEIPDRKQAIINTINDMQQGDVLLIAGKGHENYQIIGSEIFEMSDIKIVKEALQNII